MFLDPVLSHKPTIQQTNKPTNQATIQPTNKPTNQPTNNFFDEISKRIRQRLRRDSIVHIDSATFRRLLLWQGAEEEDLEMVESGEMHAAVEQDKEIAMAFRQIAFHRRVSFDDEEPFVEANSPSVTQIASEEITSGNGARVNFKRSGTRTWNLPPSCYAESSIPGALSKVNALLLELQAPHHPQPNINNQSKTLINDQILIKVNKTTSSEESPTPEGVHQDGTEVSSVTVIERKGGTSGGESLFWSLQAPTGNYDGIGVDGKPISPPPGFSWDHLIAKMTLKEPWETVYFMDRKVKHEVRPFDGIRPCHRSVIVQFLRKPLRDGADKMLIELK